MNGPEHDAAPGPPARERPFFVVGQWSGPDIEVWAVLEAPGDADERSDAMEGHAMDAEDAFGTVELVFAVSAAEAEATARREAVETAERTGRRNSRSKAGSHRRISHYYR
ncbi:hypothetical protein [Streptomyces griseiscabiei]|uniref:Uncharacterized protein n=1 Tax=Streptomyces griseiscabiei TaxID=2993540 RepID=A0ABU4LKB2_9ACTN|nr:hypothetical protein [Streptomyces griseiscabiei]MDX2916244.1 hypothetical protein [Streptomyces griseiscabiei]